MRRRARWIAPGALAAVLALGASQDSPSGPAHAATAKPPRPNIVVIQTDDQTLGQFTRKVMPNTKRLLAGHGTTFRDYVFSTSECCPSRATLLTGQYAHNHGVTSNQTAYGGLVDKGNVLPRWLQQAGYYTIHVGKFLNKYQDVVHPPTQVAPGWDQWYSIMGDAPYYRYDYYVNGTLRHRGARDRDYATRVLDSRAAKLIKAHARRTRPFYLQLDERAPHTEHGRDPRELCQRSGGAIPDPRDEGRFAHVPVPKPPSFNEKDMSDKPSFLQGLPRLNKATKRRIGHQWDCALEALRGVDRGVKQVVDAVRETGELSRTVFMFFSDNGLFFGEHRFSNIKVLPYEESLRGPLVMRVPKAYRHGAKRLRSSDATAANIDLAPTILQLAGGKPCPPQGACRTMDGRSLLPIIRRSGGWPAHRGILTEYSRTTPGQTPSCVFTGIRTPSTIYIRHTSVVDPATHKCVPGDQRERYNLSSDPFELHNLCPGGGNCPTDQRQLGLETRLAELSDCAGIAGRDPLPLSGHYCE